jgi:hypothetical protein
MINKQAGYFHKKIYFHLRKKLKQRYICSIDLRGAEIWTLWKVDQKCLESSEMWCWRRYLDRSCEK